MKRMVCFLLFTAFVGCSRQVDFLENSLKGKVTYAGRAVPFATIFAKGDDGREVNGPTDEKGAYLIVNPPKGTIRFKLVVVPPPPPPEAPEKRVGVAPAWVPPPGVVSLPGKYSNYSSDVTYDYTGGKQYFDIELK